MKMDQKISAGTLSGSKDLDPLLDRIGDSRIVMLGEATHGTHEFYTWRSAISQRLIEEKGFQFIAVEGDWPDCYKVNRYVKQLADQKLSSQQMLRTFNRWPTWMWANWEIVALVEWLKEYNSHRMPGKKIGFYGLDVYSLWESLEALDKYLQKTDMQASAVLQDVMKCFQGSYGSERLYALNSLSQPCRNDVVKLLKEIRLKSRSYNHDPEAALNTTQNAHIAVEAEKYYRNMISSENGTWNIRDKHMMDTLNRLLEFHGPQSKAIVWEHNTHVGDARYTEMKKAGMFNIGQLARDQYSENEVVIVGFGTHEGTVMAGSRWGAPMQEMQVPPAKANSIERFLKEHLPGNRLILFDRNRKDPHFDRTVPHRAIGVVYNPAFEEGNYVPSHFNRRYDAFIFIEETTALHPLNVTPDKDQVPETYPFKY